MSTDSEKIDIKPEVSRSLQERIVMWFNKALHKHDWQTTHTNKWIHPTKQKCSCGLTRTFEYKANADDINGMPWNKGHWVWSNGLTSKYCVLD